MFGENQVTISLTLLRALKPDFSLLKSILILNNDLEYTKTVNTMMCQAASGTLSQVCHRNSVTCNMTIDICVLKKRHLI